MQQIHLEKEEASFNTFELSLQAHVSEMTKDISTLFVVDLDKDALWKLYLDSFPQGTNPMFRTRTEHDCSACRHFVKSFGNVVSIKNNKITTIWNFLLPYNSRYAPVAKALDSFVKSHIVSNIWATETNKIGTLKNFEQTDSGIIITWEHLFVNLPERFINCNRYSAGEVQGRQKAIRDVFKRSLEEITEDAVLSVLELISSNSLYKGEEWKSVLETFNSHQKAYTKLSQIDRENYTWEQSVIVGPVIGKIRNHSIGTLLVDISKGTDLDEAVRKYESMVAPTNYKRPKAIFSKKMLDNAEKTITELGYANSLGRRLATLDDITINNILFANRDVMGKVLGGSLFTQLAQEISVVPKNFDKVEEIPVSKFVSEILPTTQEVEVLLENRHSGNLVSLVAPLDKNSPSMFKWDNPFSWAYTGNITDSMKERVKAAGGSVTGVLRFSIQWNDAHDNENDFDAHCIEPNGNKIYYGRKNRHKSSGALDVDIINPSRQTPDGVAVENITWHHKPAMQEGTYKFFVHNFAHRGGKSGFTAEIEFDRQVYSFAYNKELRQDERVQVAEVIYNRTTDTFSIVEKISSSLSSRKLWNLDTQKFHPVSVIMMSPNYWDHPENGRGDGIGNKHFFFMLKGCLNPEQPSGFFNEYLKNDLLIHKRVFEALSSKMRTPPGDESQLSGTGFSSTQRNSIVVRIKGHVNRILKITI